MLVIATCWLVSVQYNYFHAGYSFQPENICVRSIWKIMTMFFLAPMVPGFIYKNGVIKPMPLDKNKYLLYSHCFVPDHNGYCWISTNRGLFKSSLAELIKVFENNTSSVYYHYFGKKRWDGDDGT